MDQQQQPKLFLKKTAPPLIKFINKNDETAHHHHHHLHVTHHYAGQVYEDNEESVNYEGLEPFVGDDIESSSATASHTINLNQGFSNDVDRMLQNNINQIIQNPTGGTTRKRRNAFNQGQSPHQQFAGSSWNPIVPATDLERSSGKVICVIIFGCLLCCSITFFILIVLITLFVDSETFNDVFGYPFGKF